MSDYLEGQRPPQPATGDVWLHVLHDMEERRRHGIAKYGVPVQVGNGRDALVDAYQEALDLCAYLRQELEERDLVAALVFEIKKYVVHHGVLIGECVAWGKLKELVGLE